MLMTKEGTRREKEINAEKRKEFVSELCGQRKGRREL